MAFNNSGIAVFDIGGTWFRSGIFSDLRGLERLSKVPARNYKNTSHNTTLELQLMLVDYLVEKVSLFQSQGLAVDAASISMGAALNGHTGEILNSGPLWGPNCKKFDLLGHLNERMPEIQWTVVNDVSAALLRYSSDKKYANKKRISLITVSSGIACRTYDVKSHNIPLNHVGIQGEIGHIPIVFSLFDRSLHLTCDCGGKNHLNAFSSGRGIEQVLSSLDAVSLGEVLQDKEILSMGKDLNLFEAVKQKNELALRILDAVTYPIAQMIIHMLTIDAEIEKIIMTGGVVHGIEDQYINSLLKNLEVIGIYQIPHQTAFFKEMIDIGVDDDSSGLIGAAIAHENGNK